MKQENNPFPAHQHVPFKYGVITWNDKKNPPSQQQIKAFEKLAECALEAINNGQFVVNSR